MGDQENNLLMHSAYQVARCRCMLLLYLTAQSCLRIKQAKLLCINYTDSLG
jgi:hypothetical protein